MKENFFLKIISRVAEILFPERCLGCKQEGSPLCDTCIQKIPTTNQRTNEDTLSLFPFSDPLIQKSLWHLKYRNKQSLAKLFGRLLYEALIEELSEESAWSSGNAQPWLVIPIPLSTTRLAQRGYNQSGLIASALTKSGEAGTFEYRDDILKKTRDTQSQVEMNSRKDRLENLRGCFSLTKPAEIYGRSIVLVDDITTTGATLNEAGSALLAGKPCTIVAVTVAH